MITKWSEVKQVATTMRPIALDSKEEYLAWVRHWKERYKWISAEIRAIRNEYGAGRTILSGLAHDWHMLRLVGKEESWKRRCAALEPQEEVA